MYIRYNEKNGKIAEVVTSSGQKAEYSYNKEGFISNITAAKGTDSEYDYQYSYENGYLVRATFVGTKGGKIDYNYSYKNGNVSVMNTLVTPWINLFIQMEIIWNSTALKIKQIKV